MNDKDLEKLLRGVTDGPKPPVPDSLRAFLLELPEVEEKHHHGLVGRMRAAVDRVRCGIAFPAVPRPVMASVGVGFAIVLGVAGAGILLNMRHGNNTPAASSTFGSPAPWETPNRSMGVMPSPVVARPSFDTPPSYQPASMTHVSWVGNPAIDIENMAMPAKVISLSALDTDFLGVAMSGDGLVRSTDGLSWNWSPASAIDPKAVKVTSIAWDTVDTIVATGAVQGLDGTMDGRVWYSRDGGVTWKPAADESGFAGVAVRLVTYGSGKFVALGWNDTTPTDANRQVGAWSSLDGVTWTHITVPIKGTSAFLIPTARGFVLSGTPLASGSAIDEVPIWTSSDLQTWNRSKSADSSAQLIGPLKSASVDSLSFVVGITPSPDGMTNKMVYSDDGGSTWRMSKPNEDTTPYIFSATTVATFSSTDPSMGYFDMIFVSTGMSEGAHIYMSMDKGVTWSRVIDPQVGGPNGQYLLEIGNGYTAGDKKILAFSDPGSQLSIWLATLDSASH